MSRWVHFSSSPVETVRPVRQEPGHTKPSGLWLSDESGDDGWRSWCLAEDFRLDQLDVAHEVILRSDANVLALSGAGDLDEFTTRFGVLERFGLKYHRIDWPAVAELYHGILVTPYIWERRLTGHTFWYYGWDCASGCIWNPAAIASISVVDLAPIGGAS